MKNDIIYFIKWLKANNKFIAFLKLIFKKLFIKIFKRLFKAIKQDRYDNIIYPEYIKYKILDNKINITKKFNNKNFLNIKYIDFTKPEYLSLASENYFLHNNINWDKSFVDDENFESIHRFNWMVYCASDSNILDKNIRWCFFEIENWIDKFHKNFFTTNNNISKSLIWESYTISERISNIFIVSKCYNIKLSSKILKSIYSQSLILSKRLEFFGTEYSNHIFNNARSLYFASILFDDAYFLNISRCIFKNEITNLITKDGFLREGSSHYQLLFARWYIEILIFAKKK